MSDIEFVDGLIVKAPTEAQPEFVKARLSIKRKDLGNWLRGKTEDFINVDIKVAKGSGKWYAAVNDWKKEEPGSEPKKEDKVDDEFPDKVPF